MLPTSDQDRFPRVASRASPARPGLPAPLHSPRPQGCRAAPAPVSGPRRRLLLFLFLLFLLQPRPPARGLPCPGLRGAQPAGPPHRREPQGDGAAPARRLRPPTPHRAGPRRRPPRSPGPGGQARRHRGARTGIPRMQTHPGVRDASGSTTGCSALGPRRGTGAPPGHRHGVSAFLRSLAPCSWKAAPPRTHLRRLPRSLPLVLAQRPLQPICGSFPPPPPPFLVHC